MFISEMSHPEFKDFDLSSLRTGIMVFQMNHLKVKAGSICPTEVMKKAIKEMNLKDITICYGMTETSPVSFQTNVDDPVHLRVETVGTIHPHVECKVVDPQTGEILAPGQPGELLTKGYSVMQGYWEQPDKTAECITEDGFMKTGDIATIDEDGYCRITGRIKDMVRFPIPLKS
jgi:fatty-acyl-CoA synthase